jgi:pimeloyl-ACP methyl ester carboxylesterase/DNA-binding CsgD family transcriptional regulator
MRGSPRADPLSPFRGPRAYDGAVLRSDRLPAPRTAPTQEVGFCRSSDGTRIAWARHGSGPPLIVTTCWLSHLQFDWESPVWRHFLQDFGDITTVVRYDERGHGLSDPGVTDHSLEARVADLEAVVEASGFEQFALMGMAQGGPVAIAYAARHPERVSKLVFYGSYAIAQPDQSPEAQAMAATFEQMIRVGWARPESEFRRVFTSMMIPGATEEQMRWLDELQRVSVSAETAVLARAQRMRVDVTDIAPTLDVPTMVLHSRGDRMNGFDEGRLLATLIPGAKFVPLESNNHIVLEDEPAWQRFMSEMADFLADDEAVQVGGSDGPGVAALSPRELDVLRLVAEGLDNDEVARRLTLSTRTVERHLQNVYTKLEVQGRSARTAAVARLLTTR